VLLLAVVVLAHGCGRSTPTGAAFAPVADVGESAEVVVTDTAPASDIAVVDAQQVAVASQDTSTLDVGPVFPADAGARVIDAAASEDVSAPVKYTANHKVHTIGPVGRKTQLRIPGGHVAGTKIPLVVALHGYSDKPGYVANYFGVVQSVHQNGHMLLLPRGTKDPMNKWFWNATDACCNFWKQPIDDVAYLVGLIDEAIKKYGADPDRVMLIGHSNGGFMSHKMACEVGDRLHTIVNYAGSTFANFDDCKLTGYPNILNVHGTKDAVIQFNGSVIKVANKSIPYPSAPQSTLSWALRSGCSKDWTYVGDLDLDAPQGKETQNLEHLGCAKGNRVALWRIENGEHSGFFPAGTLINAAFAWAMK
jgi:polyhydroxybutyrate depolymerase